MNLNPYAKAIVAALIAALGGLQVASADGVITPAEWISVASAVVAALGLVWAVPNQPARPPLK